MEAPRTSSASARSARAAASEPVELKAADAGETAGTAGQHQDGPGLVGVPHGLAGDAHDEVCGSVAVEVADGEAGAKVVPGLGHAGHLRAVRGEQAISPARTPSAEPRRTSTDPASRASPTSLPTAPATTSANPSPCTSPTLR